MVFVSMAQAPPKAGAKELLYTHENRQRQTLDISVFLWLRKQRPKIHQGQPNCDFQMKELDRTTEAIVPMNERWIRLNANTSQTQYVPLCANIASHQLYRERQPLWKSRDGLNLACLDQCHGVRFQAPPKAGAIDTTL